MGRGVTSLSVDYSGAHQHMGRPWAWPVSDTDSLTGGQVAGGGSGQQVTQQISSPSASAFVLVSWAAVTKYQRAGACPDFPASRCPFPIVRPRVALDFGG